MGTNACHIVPKRFGDIEIRRITNDQSYSIFDPRNGFLLVGELHTKFDSHSFGIYVTSENRYRVHVFSDEEMKRRENHY